MKHRSSAAEMRRITLAAGLAGSIALTLAACGSDSSGPTGPSSNALPVVQSIAIGSAKVEANEDIQLTATVTDAETPVSQLKYTWSAVPAGGTFTGTGAQVTWKAPIGATTPATYAFSVTVVESYGSGSAVKENRVSFTSPDSVHYNDSLKEIAGLVSQFLTDFGTFTVSPATCVRNFSDKLCSKGKNDEMSDVTNQRNRTGVQVEGTALASTNVSFTNAARTTAASSTFCTFVDRFANGSHKSVSGSCDITAVYDEFRWYLCDSKFNGPYTETSYEIGRTHTRTITDRSLLTPFSHP